MKVYVVKAPRGEDEDYQEPILGIFIDEAKADAVIEKRNAAIAENDRKREYCEKCPYHHQRLPLGTTSVYGYPCWKGEERMVAHGNPVFCYRFLQCNGNYVLPFAILWECEKEEFELDELRFEPDDLS